VAEHGAPVDVAEVAIPVNERLSWTFNRGALAHLAPQAEFVRVRAKEDVARSEGYASGPRADFTGG
jgi:hypothetical protein